MSKKPVMRDNLYSLIPIEDFKAIMGVDDREDKTARFCLVTATLSIEQYCKRRLLRKKHFEQLPYTGDLTVFLNEYPVQEILSVYVIGNREQGLGNGEREKKSEKRKNKKEMCYGDLLEPEFYEVYPNCGTDENIPFSLSLSLAVRRLGIKSLKVVYRAGYSVGKIPADLASACLELAAWNMNRYRGKRIGMTGNIKGSGIQGEHFEPSMPENVKALLEPYRRKTI
jgi:hypothetical protein